MQSRFIIILICFLSFDRGTAEAQEFVSEVSQFIGNAARPFLQPIADGLHSSLNGGVVTPSSMPDGLHFGFRLAATWVFVTDDQKSFTPDPFSKTVEFTRNGIVFLGDLEIAPKELPTAVGLGKKQTFAGTLKRIRPKGSPYVPGIYDFIRQDASVTIGGYSDISSLMFAAPQLTVGSFCGTEASLRFLPAITVEDVGEVRSFGVGLQHNIHRYLSLPIDISISVTYQSMSINSADSGFTAGLDQSSIAASVCLSKSFQCGVVDIAPYVAAGFESSKLDVRYDVADPYIGKQSLAFESGGRYRLMAGLRMKMWKVLVNADYDVALMNGVSLGLGAEF